MIIFWEKYYLDMFVDLKNMKFLLVPIGGLLMLLQTLPIVALSQPETKSFAKWCEQKASVPVETRHTITVGNRVPTMSC
jgi:hypothetical protein